MGLQMVTIRIFPIPMTLITQEAMDSWVTTWTPPTQMTTTNPGTMDSQMEITRKSRSLSQPFLLLLS